MISHRGVEVLALLVTKFGGSSVASMEKIKQISHKIKSLQEEGNQIVVVVSAMGDTTDGLIELAESTGSNLNNREMDMLLATGEQQSAALLALALQGLGCKAISLTGWQAGIASDGNHCKAKISKITTERIMQEIDSGNIVVIAGFQGLSPDRNITTLGRGGSDTTAAAIATEIGRAHV